MIQLGLVMVWIGVNGLACDRNPDNPEYIPNLEMEAQLIPWERLTGTICYSRSKIDAHNNLWNTLFLVDVNTRQICVLANSKE